MPLNLRPFTDDDAMNNAGAEDLPEGAPPLIAHTDTAIVIVSGNPLYRHGATLSVLVELEDGNAWEYQRAFPRWSRAVLCGEQLHENGRLNHAWLVTTDRSWVAIHTNWPSASQRPGDRHDGH